MESWYHTLLDWTRYMPHGHCYLWQSELVLLQAASNSVIALSYLWISLVLWWLVHQIRDIPFPRVYLFLAAFIFLCGLTHFSDTVVIWYPLYWLDGAIRGLTAVVSVATAVLLVPLVPRARDVARGIRTALDNGVRLETAYQELADLHRRGRELEETKAAFFANVSHELRTPLTVILARVERLRRLADFDPGTAAELEGIDRNAQELLEHVVDLLQLARLDGQMPTPEPEALDVVAMIRGLVANFSAAAEQRGMVLEFEAPEDALWASLDEKLTRIVLRNLLSNALKFGPEQSRISLRAGRVASGVFLEVEDEGPGIPCHLREAVFERFRQIEEGASRPFAGTGLGLAIAREYARAQGGDVRVEEGEGGALLRVEFPGHAVAEPMTRTPSRPFAAPMAPARRAPEPSPLELPGPPNAEADVLVVDDHLETRDLVAAELAAEFRVRAVSSVEEALAYLQRSVPQLVVTDLMMSGATGEDLIQALRDAPETKCLPVLVLTARAEPGMETRLLTTGAQDVLAKPFQPSEVRVRARALVARAKRQAQLKSERDTMRRMSDELAGTVRELVHRNAELERFAYVASHDLQEPLHNIMSFSALLESRFRGDLPEEAATYLGCIVEAARRMRALIEDLLAFSRAGRQELRREPVDLAGLIPQVLEGMETTIRETEARVEVGELPSVIGDPCRLAQVFQNLVSNALKFSNGETPVVRIDAERDGAMVRVRVEDEGIGIEPGQREEIFGLFQRLHSQDDYPGTGIGLAMVRRLVDRHGGRVWVESSPREGSCFYVELPGCESRER